MTQRVITLFVCLCFAFIANGQTPERPRVDGPISHTLGTLNSSAACAPGQAPFAGTFTQSLGVGAQSNDIMFICFGDRLDFDHAGDFNLGGDPDVTTPPGIVYGLYDCAPSVTGPDLNTLKLTDGCLFNIPDPGPTTIWIVPTANFTPEGDGFFSNQGDFQTEFSGGSPIEMFFAPVTVDDFIPGSPGWESDGQGGLAGPCLHANTADVFSAVFLNEIQLLGLNNNAGGNGCTGTATIIGGLPEYMTANYVINIFLTSDPTIRGHSANATNTTHNELFTFDVPAPGDYTIEVVDPNGCTSSFPVTMGSCQPVTLEMGDSTAAPGSLFCMPITVQDYDNITSLQLTISWDNTVMTYNSIMGGNIPLGEISVGPGAAMITDSIRVNAFDFFFTPRTIPDGEVAFEVCFDIIGPLGSSSFIRIEDNDQVEITGDISVPNNRVGYIFNDGSVVVTDGSLMINVSTICASPTSPVEGGFNFSVIGGTAPYDYTYEQVGMPTNNGAGSLMMDGDIAAITMLPPGDYTINVTDNVGLMTSTMVTIQQTMNNFGAQLDETNPTCATDMNGCVTVNIFGGISPYTVIWSNGVTNMGVVGSDMICDLVVGNYSATIIDANGCQFGPAQTSLIVSAVSVDSLSLEHVTCIGGGMDGNITVLALGGTGPYQYIWNDPAMTAEASVSGLAPGNYCVTATDINMCPDVTCFDILPPSEPIIDGFDVTTVECPNDISGALTVNVTPGNAAIGNIAWSTGETGPTITDLGPGNYIVTVTALDGCEAIDSTSLTTPDMIAVEITTVQPTCPGDTDGQINLMLSGATEPDFIITWDDGSTFQTRPNLTCDSSYFVTITGTNGCDTLIEEIFLECPPEINVVFSQEMDVSCFNGDCDGQALVTASGGAATIYNYVWANGENDMETINSNAVQLCRGWNVVTVSDNVLGSNGCFVVDSVFINSPSEITIPLANTNIENASCQGDSDGVITIAASGGTPGYDYIWDDGTTGPILSGLAAGPYNVTITDANSCTELTNITVGEPDLFELLIDSSALQQVLCPSDSSGIIVVFATGGNNTGLTDYQWTDNVSTSSVGVNLKAGTYSITATDPKGCTDDILVTLEEPDPIEFVIGDIVEPQCFGFQTVVTIDTAFGGNSTPYQFSVNNGPQRPIQSAIPVLGGQSALITVFDAAGCRAEEDIVITQPAQIVVDLGADTLIQLGESTEIVPFIGFDVPVDSIVWQPLNNLVCMDSAFCLEVVVAPLESQVYTLTVFDVNGCSSTDDILVEIDKNRNVFIPNAFSPNGDGNNDTFKPYVGPGVSNVNFMRVFDRWGEILFSSDNLTNVYLPDDLDQSGWDGTLNGQRMNPGVYVYIMEVQFVDGTVLLYRGDVTLLY